jgi:hypothetical protein
MDTEAMFRTGTRSHGKVVQRVAKEL